MSRERRNNIIDLSEDTIHQTAKADALADEYVARRDAGAVVEDIPLDEVHTHMLVRDRFDGDDLELESLVTSIQELGLSNPIRVLRRPDGTGVELVQGFRRLSAYRALLKETGDETWGRVPALVNLLPRFSICPSCDNSFSMAFSSIF